MSRTTTTRIRRTLPLITGLAVGLGTLAPAGAEDGAPPQRAPEATQEATQEATLTWGLSGYAQNGIFAPWEFSDVQGDVTLLDGDSQTDYVVDPFPASSFKADQSPLANPNALRFIDGSGTVDAETGEASLSWAGSFTVNSYPAQFNAPDEIYSDPQLTIDQNGDGELSFDVVLGAGQDIDGNPTDAVDLGRLTVVGFGDLDGERTGDDSFRLNPDYFDVTNDETDQVTSCTTAGGNTGWWGSWHPEFVAEMPEFVRPHFSSTGCNGKQDEKPPLPVDVDFDDAAAVLPAVSQVSLTAPTRKFGQSAFAIVDVTSAGATSGTATLSSGDTDLGSAPVVDGQAVIDLGAPRSGTYPLSVAYSGNDETRPGDASTTLRIVKAASTSKAKLKRKPARKKNGKLAFNVSSPTADPSGRVRIAYKRPGQKNLKKTKSLNKRDRGQLTLPRAKKKGTYRVVVTYLGTRDINRSKRSLRFRVQ